MSCEADVFRSLRWSYDTAWARRSAGGRATVRFSLVFDRNTWPPAQTVDVDQIAPPGLSYPIPSPAQMTALGVELQVDVTDVTGEWDP